MGMETHIWLVLTGRERLKQCRCFRKQAVSPDGSTILYTAHVGGSNTDQCYAVAVDSNQNAYITGYTTSIDFPTVNPFQRSLEGSEDAFIAKLSSDGTSLVYSTYLGDGASGSGIAVNANGNAYVTGETGSSDFPLLMPFQSTYGGGGDAFVTKCPLTAPLLFIRPIWAGAETKFPDISPGWRPEYLCDRVDDVRRFSSRAGISSDIKRFSKRLCHRVRSRWPNPCVFYVPWRIGH